MCVSISYMFFLIKYFNKALKKHNIEYNEFKAGEFKRTVTFFGENSRKDKQKFQQEIERENEEKKRIIANGKTSKMINRRKR